jgi:tetratricopeptide (TPR) repeat protein
MRPSVAMLGFRNLSNHADTAWVSTALSEMLATELAAGEEVRTIPGETVARTKIDLGLADAESIAPDTLEQIRKSLGSDFVVLGSYLASGQAKGGQVRLDLRLEDADKKETIATVSEMGNEAQLLSLVSQAGSRLRDRLGLSPISPLEAQGIQASVASDPEAMRLYSQGLMKLRTFDSLAARGLLTGSVEADPSYPLAHSALASTWLSLGYDANAGVEAKRALDLSDKLTREDHLLVEARYYEAGKNWQQATETYRALFNLFPDNLDYGLALARAQTSAGKGKDAIGTLATLLRMSLYAEDDPRIDLAMSEAATSFGDDKLRRDASERAAAKATRQGANLLLARARTTECRALANLGDSDKAKTSCDEAVRIFNDAGDRGGLARALHTTAEIPLNQGDLISAEKLYRQALSILQEIGDQKSTGSELGNLGLIYVKRGDFATGHKLYAQALRSSQLAGDKNGIAVVMGNTGNLLRSEGRLSEALVHYETTFKLSNELGHRGSAALCLQAIGEVLMEKGDLAGAYNMYQQAMAIQQEIGAKSNYASSMVSVGEVFRQQAESDKALKAYQEAESLQQQLGEKGSVAETQLGLAELAYDSGEGSGAENLTRTALQEFQTQNEPVQEISAQGLLAKSLLLQGKISGAEESIARASKLSEKTPDTVRRLSLSLDNARVLAATQRPLAAETAARQVLTEAHKLGLGRLELEAALDLDKIQLGRMKSLDCRNRLAKLSTDARTKGFVLIAQQAATAATVRF